ncbi:Ppx/GppA phosphatase family protein [Polymorphobacter fuscus]|uniref:Ppx/GppA family phosphatase n=1 Tax=Sandarakinorhabdus fusca TaxID=1439888 RepID=A0A7C9KWM2_9SPHN|nr:Ppx/GppA phosphatase family protein [Polymorphobacter fuscus]KAB7648579.1 Ppx/GppA family phosphatase [Polymorphobacter fuscus]MQT16126.1 Ppx/GppA family phosphatase [Polymorphobacter fuscus]NJC07595.1 exopolyphosphatase/guanosine-5'-triphosphate,3'-diphosphate pyrophosphatase [Polymorphobacter fuscus]
MSAYADSAGSMRPGTGQERGVPTALARGPRYRRGRSYGALDLGTNNCRLLIAQPGPQGFVIIDAYSRVVRLGEGLMESGRLSDAAMDRTVAALAACADKLARRDVRLTRNVATEACRRAANGVRFVERVYAETGIALDVISAAEEARLAVLGCQTLIDPAGPPALVFDIGGGSSELMLVSPEAGEGGQPAILDWISLPWGVVSLAETEPQWPRAEDRAAAYARMLGRVTPLLDRFAARLAARQVADVQLLGTSGTITTLASVELGLPGYDRRRVDGCRVGTESMTQLCRSIAARSVEERSRIACVGADRAELIVAGCAILDAILMRWPGGEVRVADRGIREGILRSLMARDGVWTATS